MFNIIATCARVFPSENSWYACDDVDSEERSGSALFRITLMSRGDFLTICCISLKVFFLLQPFYQDNEPTKEQLKLSAIYTRRVQIPGAFMIFWAIGFLILLKLEYSNAVLTYSMVAFAAPIVWLGLKKIAKTKL